VSFILTFSGRKFFPLDPRAEDVCIEDIAHHLAQVCRFTGACWVAYTVAEHSVRVARLLPPRLSLYGLLHDAGEAYLADVARPVKDSFPAFRKAEEGIMRVVHEAFGMEPLTRDDARTIALADDVLLATEARDLMPRDGFWDRLPTPLQETIEPWTHRKAEEEFTSMFWALRRPSIAPGGEP
jgi:hypothetical protein